MSQPFRTDARGVSELAALGMILFSSFVLAIALGIFMLAG